MPYYDYGCNECTKAFVVKHGFDGPKTAVACPTCKSERTHKRISAAPSIIFNWWKPSASRDGAGLTHRRHFPAIPKAGG